LPELEKVRQELELKGVGFAAVCITQSDARVRQAAARLGLTMPVAIAQGGMLGPLSVKYVPTTLFIDAEGKIVASATGQRSYEFLRDRARELVP